MTADKKGEKHSFLKLAVEIKSALKGYTKGIDSKKLEKKIDKYSAALAEQIEKLKKQAGKKAKKVVPKKKKAAKKAKTPAVKAKKK